MESDPQEKVEAAIELMGRYKSIHSICEWKPWWLRSEWHRTVLNDDDSRDDQPDNDEDDDERDKQFPKICDNIERISKLTLV